MPKLFLHTFILAFFLFISISFAQSKLLFRYNSDYTENSNLNSDVLIKSVSIDYRFEDEEETARGADGWEYPAHKTTLFYTDSSSIKSSANVLLNYFGDHEISGEIWLKSFSSSSDLFSWDDTTKPNGINISLQDDKVVLSRKINGEVFTLLTDSSIQQMEWYHVSWFNKVIGTTLQLGIIIDKKASYFKEFSLSLPAGLISFSAPVYLGNSQENNSVFNGEIYAANLKNYIPDSSYLYAGLTFDGSGYLGSPSFHDYPVGSPYENIDKRITQSPTPYIDPIFIPYTGEDFIPQGLTNSYEDESFSGYGMIYLAMYNKTLDDKTGLRNSIIVEINPLTKKIRRTFRLQGALKTSHVGGIAFHNNSIYVSSGRKIEIYPLPVYQSGDGKYQDLTSNSSKLFSVSSIASFCSYFNDTLWVGDYQLASDGNAYLSGYKLNSNGDLVTSDAPTIYRLPFQTQGAAWKIYNNKKYLFISASGGDAGSKVYRVSAEKLSKLYIPVEDTVFNVPAGGEDLSFNQNGDLLNQSESSSKYFQKRANPWNTFFPFVFVIKEETLFRDIATSIDESGLNELIPQNFQLINYPNPFNNQTKIKYTIPSGSDVELKIYDLLGREIALLKKGFLSPGRYSADWNASLVSSGIYFLILKSNGRIVSTNKLVLMK